jgi:hypothetical protein
LRTRFVDFHYSTCLASNKVVVGQRLPCIAVVSHATRGGWAAYVQYVIHPASRNDPTVQSLNVQRFERIIRQFF